MPLSESVLLIACLLAVAVLAAGLCRDLPVPFTVVLVVLGLALGELAQHVPVLAPLEHFRLRPELVFFVFLPALIFESGFNLDARRLLKNLAPVLVLAVPALLISTAVIGIGLAWALDLPLRLALLFGALISATDPVAVIALFKEVGAPARLTVLLEGESLLNDATAIVVFGILLGLVASGEPIGWGGAGGAILDFVRVFAGGAVVGVLIALVLCELMHWLRENRAAILVTSLVLAYSSFVLAEHVLHLSGVMATTAAALTLGAWGVTRISQEDTSAIGETWELLALVCNSLLFLLVGLSVDPAALAGRTGVILVAVALVLVSRAAAVHTMIPATTRLFSLPAVHPRERHVLWWGGLKGGLAIAIVLSIPPSLEGRALLLDLTLGVVLFTLLVNAPTIRPLMERLGLTRMTDEERAELRQGLRAARAESRSWLERFRAAGVLSRAQAHRVDARIDEALSAERPVLGRAQRLRHLRLAALRAEEEMLHELHEIGLVSEYTFLEMRANLRRDRERSAGDDDRADEPRANPFLRVELSLLRRLRERDWAGRLLARYQTQRLAQHLRHTIAGILTAEAAVEALAHVEAVEPDLRAEAARAYRDRLVARRERLEQLRIEFPDFYPRFTTRLLARVALRCAARASERDEAQGVIGTKARAQIVRGLRRATAAIGPAWAPLSTLSARDLVGLVPLFEGLSADALASVAARAVTVTFLPGDTIIGEQERGDALYIVTRGRVSVYRGGGDGEARVAGLGEGDFFGETGLLGDHVRTASVRADVPTTLLRIGRRAVLRLAEENEEVRRRLEEARAARAG